MPVTDTYVDDPYAAPKGLGWVAFAAMMLGFAGVVAVFDGILALSSSKVFTAHASYVFSDLHTWGWIIMILGVLSVIAAFSLLLGSELGRWFGVAVAALNAFGQLMFVHANPWWAMAMFAIDILIIWALAVYGGSRLKMR
jgi:hypothetical protein